MISAAEHKLFCVSLRLATAPAPQHSSSVAHARCGFRIQGPAVLRPDPHETGVKLLYSASHVAAKSHLDWIKSACHVRFVDNIVVVGQECCFVIVAEGTFDSAGHTTAWESAASISNPLMGKWFS